MPVLEIGLVNNMPDSALGATQRQFVTLLNEAAGNDVTLCLTFYALPSVPRTPLGLRDLSSYSVIGDLWGRALDGIVVTGTEPLAANLSDEPYWSDLTRLVLWAEQNTASAVWSCLAAHAAVLYMDGIRRRRFSEKRFGIFEHLPVGDSFLTADTSSLLRIPHSRWNDVQEDELKAADYDIITRSVDGGVDAFVKRRKSLFVFFQGHPEYEADTLLLEYRRDIKRFLRHECDVYPTSPSGYSNPAWTDFRNQALSDRREETIADFPIGPASGAPTTTWRKDAVRIYRNWLLYLVEWKGRKSQPQADYSCVPSGLRRGDSFGAINPSRNVAE
jgi:homoserine O-succinyltransferase